MNKAIYTTKTKAKEASRFMDKLITLGKQKSIVSQRRAFDILRDRDLVAILFNELAPLCQSRNGGYTRVMLLAKRQGDNAQMALLELVEKPKPKEPVKKKEAKEKKKVVPEAPVTEIEKKEEHKKEQPPKEPKKPEKPFPKPGFFKKIFGRKVEK